MHGQNAAQLLQERSDILVPRKWTVQCDKSKDDTDLIKLELKNAKRIADYAHDHIDDDSDDTKRYLLGFVPKKLRDLPKNSIVEQLQEGYGNGAHILGDGDKYKMKVTCDQETVKCKAGYFAHMRDGTKTMNICNAWFNPKGTPAEKLDPPAPTLHTTAEILKGCKEDKETYKVLENFWTGKAQALLHEVTHTSYFTGVDKALDYCYGVQNSLNLAHGSYKVGTKREFIANKVPPQPLCPSEEDPTEPGYCNPDLAVSNADTLAIMAGGMFWSAKAQCDRSIEIGLTAQDQAANPQDVAHAGVGAPVSDAGTDD
ncbi:MAG: hypothetical protein Q9178_008078 [Gyalolechia marmorata]